MYEYLPACLYEYHMCAWCSWRSAEGDTFPGTGDKIAVNFPVGAGDWAWVPYRSSKCSWLLSHLWPLRVEYWLIHIGTVDRYHRDRTEVLKVKCAQISYAPWLYSNFICFQSFVHCLGIYTWGIMCKELFWGSNLNCSFLVNGFE